MREAIDDEPLRHLVADTVGECRAEILRGYADWLGVVSGGDPPRPASPRLLEQAGAVLDDACRRMVSGNGTAPPAAGTWTVVADGPLPGQDLIRASGALLRVALRTVAAVLRPHPGAALALCEFATAVHESILDRFTSAAEGYTGYLVDQLHRSHLDERRRVARDLHDLIAHSVAVALQNLELSAVHRHRDEARADAKLNTALENLRGTLNELRAISRDLRRSAAAGGLTAGLRSYLETASFERETDLRVVGDESIVPLAVQGELFLVLREALRNAHVHGHAAEVRLQVDISAQEVRAVVRDNGDGFGTTAAPGQSMGTGLVSMRERVALLGGNIEVCGVPGEGTSVSVRVPLTRAWDEPEE